MNFEHSETLPEGLRDAPAEFAELLNAPPAGWTVSERVLEPCIRISAENGFFSARLFGRHTLRGVATLLPAGSMSHNWVADAKTIRPLPCDTPELIRSLMPGGASTRLSFSGALALIRRDGDPVQVIADESVFSPAKAEADRLTGLQPVPGLKAELFPYQARGVGWMLDTVRHTGGLILADEMGLGKTIQIISLLLSERPDPNSPALIVCPTSLIANWRQEILRFAPGLSIMIHRGPGRAGVPSGLQRADIVITTYDTLVNDESIMQAITWSWLILDEAQAVKNPDSSRRKVAAGVPRLRTIPMTGTPVETSLTDLWSLADLAIPGLLGTREEFEDSYPNDEAAARAVARFTDPIVLRRRVSDVAADLPERTDIDIPLELGPELSEQYARVREETLARYPVAGAMVATGQLQLFCAHPWLRADGAAPDDGNEHASVVRHNEAPLMTPKMERTIALLLEAFGNGRKVLLFALYNRCGELIREAATGFPPAFWGAINGSTPQEDRQKIVDDFSAHEGPGCLVLNPKAAGMGLNITAATVVIHFTQAWNPALEAQASARAHRRGQTEPVQIYRLFYEDTVERVMVDRSAWRRELGNEAVPISTRDEADLRLALTIGPAR
jgi:SNF2 family DNA or RNA helicase